MGRMQQSVCPRGIIAECMVLVCFTGDVIPGLEKGNV